MNNVIFWQSIYSSTGSLIIVCFHSGFIFPQKTICLVFLLLHGVTGGMSYYFFYIGICYISGIDVAVFGAFILPFLFIS